MPVHAHHAPEGLEPEGIAQSREQCRSPVVVDDRLADGAAERDHARGEPRGHTAAVQRQIGHARSLHDAIVTRDVEAVREELQRAVQQRELDAPAGIRNRDLTLL
jgi:hypothetical protein